MHAIFGHFKNIKYLGLKNDIASSSATRKDLSYQDNLRKWCKARNTNFIVSDTCIGDTRHEKPYYFLSNVVSVGNHESFSSFASVNEFNNLTGLNVFITSELGKATEKSGGAIFRDIQAIKPNKAIENVQFDPKDLPEITLSYFIERPNLNAATKTEWATMEAIQLSQFRLEEVTYFTEGYQFIEIINKRFKDIFELFTRQSLSANIKAYTFDSVMIPNTTINPSCTVEFKIKDMTELENVEKGKSVSVINQLFDSALATSTKIAYLSHHWK
ncbi:hypothetical protein CANMA_003955 [Candida margitis]|uniref:uncharacterized protein n=1 Tax=Candida margitis TaxID=1775924 RepID=UPI0022277753|nr:uncharacterized protein CANMA_003955 [Candida margitis]KAI5960693.1 hypothetical protein CANMA_003955 [Candida margitis]